MDYHRESIFVDFLMRKDFIQHQIVKLRAAALIVQVFPFLEPFYFALLCKIAYLEEEERILSEAIDWMAFNVVWQH